MAGGTSLENAIKQKLGIKWIDARKLGQEAQANLGLAGHVPDDRYQDVVDEASFIFEDLPPEQQAVMKAPEGNMEPDWKRKAREQAEKREREWEAAALGVDGEAGEGVLQEAPVSTSTVITQQPPRQDGDKIKVRTHVTTTKIVDGKPVATTRIETMEVDPSKGKHTTVYCCTIL